MNSLNHLILLLIVVSCTIGDELPPDQELWEYEDPSIVGLNEQTLLSIDSEIKVGQYERITGLVIIKDDKMVFENYYDSSFRQDVITLGPASISISVAAIGSAVDQGFFSLDDPIHQFLPTYEAIFNEDVRRKDITIRHLLTHRSGIGWNERVVSINSSENHLNQMFASSDWVQFVLNQPLEAIPGARTNFNSGTGTILTRIIQNATQIPFDIFIHDNLLTPIGITTFSIRNDPSGNFDGGTGGSISFLDWAKFGYLMLNEGIWEGRRIIDPNFIREASSLQVEVSNSSSLGYGWSLFGSNFDFLPIDRTDIYYIRGHTGQHQYIIPSQNMIIQIKAENFFFASNAQSLNLFIEITNAIQ